MKIAAQRLEKCVSTKMFFLFEASATSLVWTVFSVPLSSYDCASFALCTVGGDRSQRIRLAGAHVGDLLLHDRPCSEDHHHAHGFLSNSEDVRLTLELPLPFYKLVAQAVVVQARKAGKSLVPHVDYERPFTSTNMVQVSACLQPRGGKAPPVLAEHMSTTSLSICPGTAAQLLPELRQVFSFRGAPKDSILKHVVVLSLSLPPILPTTSYPRSSADGRRQLRRLSPCDQWYPFLLARMFEIFYSNMLCIGRSSLNTQWTGSLRVILRQPVQTSRLLQ